MRRSPLGLHGHRPLGRKTKMSRGAAAHWKNNLQFPCPGTILIDKNSLRGGLNIQKRELCVKGILAGKFSTILAQDLAGLRDVVGN
jgi:hypothetical protein